MQVFLFSLPLFKGNTDGTILTLDADTARGVTGTFFGVFFPCAVPPFTEDICFKTNKPKKNTNHDHYEKLFPFLASVMKY